MKLANNLSKKKNKYSTYSLTLTFINHSLSNPLTELRIEYPHPLHLDKFKSHLNSCAQLSRTDFRVIKLFSTQFN